MSTGVLPFVRGVDFSRNDFSGQRFPHELEQMTQMTWLKLNRAQLERVPDELSRLTNLEHLQMTRNMLTNVHGELSDLPHLRSVIVRNNQIKTSGIPTDIFRMKDLTIIDFSNNSLRDVPSNLEYAKCTIVLNLGHNNIENIPNQVFSNLVDLIYLDLSDNKLDVLQPQIRRLINLQVLKLSNNPLNHFQLKLSQSMKTLRVLTLRNTHRNPSNLPPDWDDLENLQELDLAQNDLTTFPVNLHQLKNLRKLDLSMNKITKIEFPEGSFERLRTLNISVNELTAFPEGITRCTQLQKIYASYNQLVFGGLPPGIGKLIQLEILHLSHNELELIPEGISRCVKLQKLKLDSNKLITLPDGVHLLPDLKEMDLQNNPDLVMPPKPADRQKALAFYNIDFSLSHQMQIAGQSPHSSSSSFPGNTAPKDPTQRRKDFIRRRRHQADEDSASKVIQGMSKIARDGRGDAEEANDGSGIKPALTWKEKMEKNKPNLDYSVYFDDYFKTHEGLWVWEIENFNPRLVDEEYMDNFYEGDCYLILKGTKEISGNISHEIYYWIGEKSTLDKGMCAAVHAVNLRNFLGASCRTIREEQNDESDEFLELFGGEIMYVTGAHTTSGFFTVEKTVFVTHLYRASVNGSQVEMEPVPVSVESLDPRFVFLLDTKDTIWVWSGARSRITVANKVRLFAVRMNKRDRKGEAEIESCNQFKTPEEFWLAFHNKPTPPEEPIVEHVPLDFKPERKKLYQIQIGMGFIELPQIELKNGLLRQKMLQTKCVYILDCISEIYLWVGKKANRLLKMAGHKLINELHAMLERPEYTNVSRETEGEESTMFRSKFIGWDDVLPFDFTMTADTVQRRGTDVKVILERDKMKTDLVALFLDRLPAMSHEDADQMIEECNEDLEVIEAFVLEDRRFVRLPSEEMGIFYNKDCYVFLCRYYVPSDESELSDEDGESEPPPPSENDFKCVVYFWQGREAPNMGWLHFTFTLQKKFEELFKDKLEVVRMYQQQENHKFLSHFNKRFVIRRGMRKVELKKGGTVPELFHCRANGSAVCTRTIQVDCNAIQLNSAFTYILRRPFEEPDEEDMIGTIYVWIGRESDGYFRKVVEDVANNCINIKDNNYVVTINEGDEPDGFWEALGGKKAYDTEAGFMSYTRLFRCTNEKGYFSVSEKTVDFCQDDLDDDDVMIVDNGSMVFLWVGTRASDIEGKLAYKAAQVYIGHMANKQPDKPRKLVASLKYHESKRFRRLFHGWAQHKIPAGD
uniref:Protein flightless-1-like protein n=1 Tax=Panagrellus redivivus TaxID=6233 RepID=A0A7E4W5T9_PANRE